MESALFFIGVLLFAALTLNYLRIAFQTALYWLLLGIVFLPSCIVFYAKHWDRYKPQAIVHGASCVALALFATLYIRAYPFEFEHTAAAPLRNFVAPAFAEAPLDIEPLIYATDAEMSRYLKPGHKRAVIQVEQRRLRMKRAVVSNGIIRFKTLVHSPGSVEVAIDLNQANISIVRQYR